MFMSNIEKAGRLALAFDVMIKTIKAIPEEKLTIELSDASKPSVDTDILYRSRSDEADSSIKIHFLCIPR